MKIVRYFFVGGIAAGVDLAIFFLFAKLLGFHYILVSSCGFLVATFVNYALSVRLVFQSGARFSKRQEIVFLYLVSGVGLALNQAVLYVMVSVVTAELMLSKLTATVCVFFWNYYLRNAYIFRPSLPVAETVIERP